MNQFLVTAAPMLLVGLGAFVLMLASHVKGLKLRHFMGTAVTVLAAAFLFELPRFGGGERSYLLEGLFGTAYIVDDFSILFDLMFFAGAALTLLINAIYLKKRRYFNGEFFSLFLFAVFGMTVLAHANDLLVAFMGLEIASLSVYALVGYHKNNPLSGEAMFKYLVLGAMASALFLMGVAILYGLAGTTSIPEIAEAVRLNGEVPVLALVTAGLLIFAAILFKIGAVPFHAWVLDVYHGAPFPVTMFMASTFKIAIFAVALRLYLADFGIEAELSSRLFAAVTVLTLLGGSWLALTQTVLKRMLAASSIVHGGYMLIAFSSIGLGSQIAAPAIMFYLLSYFISSVGAFGILSYIAADAKRALTYEDFKGFAVKRPYLAAMMAVFMLSLSGFPSTIGFLGKFYIFTSAIESRQFLLAGLGILIAFVSVYYYFKLIAMMYFYDADEARAPFRVSLSTSLIALMALMAVWGGIGTGLIPFLPGADGLIDMAKEAVASLG